jgi:uncharacterized protein (DUF302 family)
MASRGTGLLEKSTSTPVKVAPRYLRAEGVSVEEMTEYGYTVEVPEGYDEAVLRTRLAMRGEGFSIISEMHVGGLLGPEAGEERQYLIMGAWGAAGAQREVGEDLQVGVHLPCNVVVQEKGSMAFVAALDPVDQVAEEAAIPSDIADAARGALGRMLERVTVPL